MRLVGPIGLQFSLRFLPPTLPYPPFPCTIPFYHIFLLLSEGSFLCCHSACDAVPRIHSCLVSLLGGGVAAN